MHKNIDRENHACTCIRVNLDTCMFVLCESEPHSREMNDFHLNPGSIECVTSAMTHQPGSILILQYEERDA